jgi:S-methylmethionine-dependent homocysteine/selenocysteine methylase
VHEDYLRAGADVVETDTYHLCEANLCGLHGATVEGLAQLAVETLDAVVRQYGAHQLQSGGVESQREIRRALSLGPYAVALADASEVCSLPYPPFTF